MTVECCDCKTRQGVNENCVNCGLKFGQVVRLRILAFKFVSVLFLVPVFFVILFSLGSFCLFCLFSKTIKLNSSSF